MRDPQTDGDSDTACAIATRKLIVKLGGSIPPSTCARARPFLMTLIQGVIVSTTSKFAALVSVARARKVSSSGPRI
jgi:hypothetical protein